MKKKEKKENKLLPLRKFAEGGFYSPAYLSNLVQRKKLRAEKIGRNYFTTQEWFNEYLEKHGRKKDLKPKAKKFVCTKTVVLKKKAVKKTEDKEINIEELSEKIAEKVLAINASTGREKEEEIQEENLIIKDEAKRERKKIFWHRTGKVSVIVCPALIIAAFFWGSFSQTLYHAESLLDGLYLSPMVGAQRLVTDEKNMADQAESFSKESFDLDGGRVAGVSESKFGFELIDEDLLFGKTKEAWSFFVDKSWQFVNSFAMAYNNLCLAVWNLVGPVQTVKEETVVTTEDKVRSQGAVVVPFTNEENAQEIKQKIEMMFSDNVVVEPDEGQWTGIVKPVFGAETSDQKYLYMMVPVAEE